MSIRTDYYRNVFGDVGGVVLDLNVLPERKIPFMRGEDICHLIQHLYYLGYPLGYPTPGGNKFSNEPLSGIYAYQNRLPGRVQLDSIHNNIRTATNGFWLKHDATAFPRASMAFVRNDATNGSIKKIFRNELSLRLVHDDETGLDLPMDNGSTIHYIPYVEDVNDMMSYVSIMKFALYGDEDARQVKTWYLGEEESSSSVAVRGTINEDGTTTEYTGRNVVYVNATKGSTSSSRRTLTASNFVQYYLGAYRPIGTEIPLTSRYIANVYRPYARVFINYSRSFGSGDTSSGQWSCLITKQAKSPMYLSEIVASVNSLASQLGINTNLPSSGTGSVTLEASLQEWAGIYELP